MPNATTEQKIASAYNRMGRTSAEGGLQPKEYFAKYGADRVRALGANWLGSTLGCAECHDHKFDPVLTKDFYALKAFFADVKEDGLVADVGPDAFSPKMPVYQTGEKERIDNLIRQIAAAKTELDAKADDLAEQRRQWERETLEHAKSWRNGVEISNAGGGIGANRKADHRRQRTNRGRNRRVVGVARRQSRWSRNDCCGWA